MIKSCHGLKITIRYFTFISRNVEVAGRYMQDCGRMLIAKCNK